MSNSVRYPMLEAHPVAWAVGKLMIGTVVTVFIIAVIAVSAYFSNTSPRAPGFPTPPAAKSQP